MSRPALPTLVLPLTLAAAAAAAPTSPPMTAPPAAALAPIVDALVARHGEASRARAVRGVGQAAALWTASDGDLGRFCQERFVPAGPALEALLGRLEYAFEMLDGHLGEIGRELRRPSDLDEGPLLPVDALLAAFDPGAHLTEDLFTSKIGFVALLNFPLTTLAERQAEGAAWDRRTWAAVRLAGRFARRVPGEVQQQIAAAASAAELYIAEYNLWMHHLLDERGQRPFGRGLRLISHWNLRDELKAAYADPDRAAGLGRQRMIVQVMERIVTQSIPAAVIDNPRLDWNPFDNAVTACPAAEVEPEAAAQAPGRSEQPPRASPDARPEPDTRYARLLAQFAALARIDRYSPAAPTAIARSFEQQRELPEERVVAMLKQVLESKLVPKVAAAIQKRLGRPLEPQDLWYAGFVARARFPEAELDAITRRKYPTAAAFAADIPRLLGALGFAPERAAFLASHIVVDPARGAGHALPAGRRGDLPHLRTRVEPGGMNYKGYNIAVHELGHNVEQVISLYEVDHTLLQGVPNNAFTEALAFVFQAKDLELLGLSRPDPASERMRVLHDFWQTWEIAGVALVDLAVWHWMYDHPGATAAELREATVVIARQHWNRYYAPVLGPAAGKKRGGGSGGGSIGLNGPNGPALLAVYSHMISYPLYLSDYPIGHLIAFQIEEQMKKAGAVGPEFERMARQGAITPDRWMVGATGAPVGPAALLAATEAALASR